MKMSDPAMPAPITSGLTPVMKDNDFTPLIAASKPTDANEKARANALSSDDESNITIR